MKLILNIEPKPQSRPRFARRGSFTTTYEDKDMKAWRNHCQLLIANQYMGQPILEGSLRRLDFTSNLLSTFPRSRRTSRLS